MIEQSIYEALRDHAGLSALISGRAYPQIMPQGGTFPAVTFSRISASPVNSLSGFSGLDNGRFQVDVWGETYLGAKQVAGQVKAAMESAATFKAVRAGERDLYESNGELHRIILDFSAWAHT